MQGQASTLRQSAGQSVLTPEGLTREANVAEIFWEWGIGSQYRRQMGRWRERESEGVGVPSDRTGLCWT